MVLMLLLSLAKLLKLPFHGPHPRLHIQRQSLSSPPGEHIGIDLGVGEDPIPIGHLHHGPNVAIATRIVGR